MHTVWRINYSLVVTVAVFIELLTGCMGSSQASFPPFEEEIPIELKDSAGVIDDIADFDISDDNLFIAVLSNIKQSIAIFDTRGQLISTFCHAGRSNKEYVHADKIILSESKVFIWDSSTLRCLIYDLDGGYVDSLGPFKTNVRSIDVIGNFLIFYDLGKSDNLIEIFDKEKKEFISSTGLISSEQKVLSIIPSPGPFAVDGNMIYYMTTDKLNLFCADFPDCSKEEKLFSLKSKSFIRETVIDHKAITKNISKLNEYHDRCSRIIGLISVNGLFYIFTKEGRTETIGHRIKDIDSHVCLYAVNRTGEIKSKTNHETPPVAPELLKCINGNMYYLVSVPLSESEEKHILHRIIL